MTRTEALCRILGWQGGTIHQVAKEIGVSTHDIIYGDSIQNDDYKAGWHAARNHSPQENHQHYFSKHKGNKDFWIGAADGYGCMKGVILGWYKNKPTGRRVKVVSYTDHLVYFYPESDPESQPSVIMKDLFRQQYQWIGDF